MDEKMCRIQTDPLNREKTHSLSEKMNGQRQ